MYKQFVVVFVIAMMLGSTIQQSLSGNIGGTGSQEATGGVTGSGSGGLGPININGDFGKNGSESTSGEGNLGGSLGK
ncbi:uncharacterized PE-PGRS family protein PE_PGRS46-like [Spodoptera frugiperda]|uniref:Uncharacterized PE-PGRS family protein PE_PGRS46-like n=1 Tax=Spodoptera frugiperda TaxID=7108 RepID=A0A9R0DTG7_SPOFR|nr:uncharacterized PE-PGRS family protein PE_PGRS46-like [Spodoptera frugiperda]